MVRYYETIAPENAAVLFNKLGQQTAIHILLRMNPRKASAVLQLMDPEVAVAITEKVTRFEKEKKQAE